MYIGGLQAWPDRFGIENYHQVLTTNSGFTKSITAFSMLKNSLIVAIACGLLTSVFSIMTAFVIVYCRFPAAKLLFWGVFVTLLFPIESRMITTFSVSVSLGLFDTYLGMTLPILAGALGTFFFRQFFLTQPVELAEAARMDGAGPIRFFIDIIIPLSWSRIGVVFIISFMFGWNQYLWPIMITNDESYYTLMRGIQLVGRANGPGMALIVLSILPPFLLVLIFQRWLFSSLADRAS